MPLGLKSGPSLVLRKNATGIIRVILLCISQGFPMIRVYNLDGHKIYAGEDQVSFPIPYELIDAYHFSKRLFNPTENDQWYRFHLAIKGELYGLWYNQGGCITVCQEWQPEYRAPFQGYITKNAFDIAYASFSYHAQNAWDSKPNKKQCVIDAPLSLVYGKDYLL
jgi:hypothetical protein